LAVFYSSADFTVGLTAINKEINKMNIISYIPIATGRG